MTDITALPGSIEPAGHGGPKLDHGVNPLTLILFMGVLAAGLLFAAYSIYSDIDAAGAKLTSYLPFLLLFVVGYWYTGLMSLLQGRFERWRSGTTANPDDSSVKPFPVGV